MYASFAFLAPLLALATVVAVDRAFLKYYYMSSENDQASTATGQVSAQARELAGALADYRPGFGEESCWFTSCSRALSVFLYGYAVNDGSALQMY